MKRVGVREFRDRATKYLASDEPIAVERHGRPIGFYIPVKRADDEEVREALDALDRAVKQVLEETGMTEDELVRALDISRRG
jgi:hypothetical protein